MSGVAAQHSEGSCCSPRCSWVQFQSQEALSQSHSAHGSRSSKMLHQLFLFLSHKLLSLAQSYRQDHRRSVLPKGQSRAGLMQLLSSAWQMLSQRLQGWLLPVLSQGWLVILRQESAESCEKEMLSFLQWISSGLFLSAPWFLQMSAYRNSWCWARQPWCFILPSRGPPSTTAAPHHPPEESLTRCTAS